MKDRLKVGNRITCIIEQAETNFIIVSFRSSGNCYRGVLINENNSTVRRTIPSDFFPIKEVLDQETTVNFCNEIANRELDNSSTTTRSKTSKLSYIILDDYDLPNSNDNTSAIGMSPIDSIRGLVESIDTNKVLSIHSLSSRKNTTFSSKLKVADQSKKEGNSHNMKVKPIQENFNSPKKSGLPILDSNSKLLKSPVKILNRSSNTQSIFSLFPADESGSANIACKTEPDSLTVPVSTPSDMLKGSQKSQARKRKLEDPLISGNDDKKPKQDSKTFASMKVCIPMKNIKKETADKLLSTNADTKTYTDSLQKKKKRKRKGLLLQKRKRPTKSHISEDLKSDSCLPQPQATTRVIKPRTSKRVDPILIALKNIKKYDSLRKKRNLHNSIPMLDDSKPVSLRKRRNTRRNAKKTRLNAKTNVRDPVVTQKQANTAVDDGDKVSGNENETERTKFVDDYKPVCLDESEEKQEFTKSKVENNNLSEVNEGIQIETSKLTSTTDHTDTKTTERKSSSPNSVDLLCHEAGFTINETGAMKETVFVCKPRTKNRRKPIQVFKSLPNPAEEKRKQEEMTGSRNVEENKSETVPISRRRSLLQKGHNTRFRGTKSVLPCLNISPRRSRKPKKETSLPAERQSEKFFEDKDDCSDVSTLPYHAINEVDKLEKASSCGSNDIDDFDTLNSSPERRASDQESVQTTDHKEKSAKNRKRKKPQLMIFFESLKPLTRCNNEIRVGDVVWGKCQGHGWWPGHVLSFSKFAEDTPVEEREAQVSWMNSNTQSLMTLKDLNLFLPYFRKRFNASKKGMYCKAVLEAQNMCKRKYGVL